MTEQLRQVIGARVKHARRTLALSQEGLAEQVRRTPESISNIERGIQLPALDTLLDIAQVLKIPITELIGVIETPRTISRERAANEARVAAALRSLDDSDVAIAADQIEA